jgi:molybdopterin synthase catalytic subunit
MEFHLTDRAIEPSRLVAGLADAQAGACVTFEGRVRNENGGRKVRALDYEAYAPLAAKEGKRIMAEARKKFQIIGAACVHRTGSLAIGDIAVWIGVVAGHRAGAFDACRYLIDEMKARLPIWKREHYEDGTSEWINCATRGPAAGLKMK